MLRQPEYDPFGPICGAPWMIEEVETEDGNVIEVCGCGIHKRQRRKEERDYYWEREDELL